MHAFMDACMDACMLDVCPMCVCVYVYASKQMHRKEQSSTDQDVWVCNQGRVIGTAQEVKQFVTHLQFKPTMKFSPGVLVFLLEQAHAGV